MAYEKSITAILVAYNSAGVIAASLTPLLKQPEIASIIVVDNCSTDETCDVIKRDFPQVKLVENPRNEGFGRGNNIGLNRTQTPYALLINPDAMLQDGALELLLAAAETYPDAAILAPALYNEQGELHVSFKGNVWERESYSPLRGESKFQGASRRRNFGRGVNPSRLKLRLAGLLSPALPQGESKIAGDLCAEYLSGAVWLLNMKLMRQVGFFDPNIFLYYEDDDLCLRAREKGYGLVYVPAARVTHLMGASSGEIKPESEFFRQQHMAWSRLYIEGKYRGKKAAGRLAARQNIEYSLKAAFYFFLMNMRRTARYRGRLQGIFAYQENQPLK